MLLAGIKNKRADRKDPVKSKKPKMPLPNRYDVDGGAFALGKQGIVRGYAPTLSMHLAKQTSYNTTRDEDPREAILKYAEEAEKNPIMGLDKAYAMYGNEKEKHVEQLDMESVLVLVSGLLQLVCCEARAAQCMQLYPDARCLLTLALQVPVRSGRGSPCGQL